MNSPKKSNRPLNIPEEQLLLENTSNNEIQFKPLTKPESKSQEMATLLNSDNKSQFQHPSANGKELNVGGSRSSQEQVCIPPIDNLQKPHKPVNKNLVRCALAEAENTIIASSPDLYHKHNHDTVDYGGGQEKEIKPKLPPAVLVREGYKNYGRQPILDDFNMCVEANTIYGLLGASGCGKTTILSCIVALRKLDQGSIYVAGYPTGTKKSGIPGKRVGYMPQEIALNGEFKVKEVLQYFGRIYGMTQLKIQERYDYIVKLLSLEKCRNNLIRNMSDGQKRRVSLAVALLHEPDILILDEPTVGCDPLLRRAIWKFLTEIVAQNKTTVIVTTHYIEETRQADKVGIMRHGRLLAEDSPAKLLIQYNASLLDDIVLKLCLKDESGEPDDDGALLKRRRSSRLLSLTGTNVNKSARTSPSPSSKSQQNHDKSVNLTPKKEFIGAKYKDNNLMESSKRIQIISSQEMGQKQKTNDNNANTSSNNRLRALIVKNWLVLFRNFGFLLFLVILPSVTVFVFCATVGSDPIDLKIGVINREVFGESIENGTNTTNFTTTAGICEVQEPRECSNANLSCLYLDSLNKNQIKLIPFDTVEAAMEEIYMTRLWGYVIFEEGFSEHMFGRLMFGKRKPDTIFRSQVRIKMDMSNKGVALTLKKLFMDGFRDFSTRLLKSCKIDPAGRDIPITFEEPIYGKDDSSMTDFMAPGVALGMIFFMGALTCGLTYIIEKKDGMINRTLVSGVSTIEIMLSHFMTQFVVVIGQVLIVLAIIMLVFGIECKGSIVLAFIIILLSSVSGMSLGFLASTFCSEEKNAMLLALGTVFPSFLLAGLIWPIESAPRIVQYISFLLPGTLIADAFRSVLGRGFSITHHVVWGGFIAAFCWIGLYWLFTVMWHKFSRRRL